VSVIRRFRAAGAHRKARAVFRASHPSSQKAV
jgi:hypothetical protein